MMSRQSSAGWESRDEGPINLSGLVCNVRRTTGREPHPLVGATTTILGDKLYVFGGRILSRSRPQLTSDLYELDLIRRHWTKIEAGGDVPPPRYFHSMCPLGDQKLVCYGGMSPVEMNGSGPGGAGAESGTEDSQPEVVVMSDIHIFDVPSRLWTRVPSTESPQGRYAHCATILPSSAHFTSSQAPLSAIHHNPASNQHQGSIGVDIDGFGGAEMVVVGGQDSSNHYIEQISVFNLRSLRWTSTAFLGRSCGAYRSVVAPLVGMNASEIGSAAPERDLHPPIEDSQVEGCPMLVYSNYNFLDVKLELQIRLADGRLVEKPMPSQASPPGLRFPNGGVINGHFIVSGTYLTSSKQEYALWALDLKTLTWGRIDAGGSVFGQGSWNRGMLWSRRNSFVILGHRKRSLVEDYNHRRINFSHLCLVELEAFGLYNNPCRTAPSSAYQSYSAPSIPASLQHKLVALTSFGGKPFTPAADELGRLAHAMPEMSDMELQAIGGERIPVNSRLLTRRWGPYFIQLLRESGNIHNSSRNNSIATGMSMNPALAFPNRNSSITITPGQGQSHHTSMANLDIPSAHSLSPMTRPRLLYLPHTYLTLQVLVHYLYTAALPPPGSPLCTPQILCSLLQLARPYQINGLLEATIERLHAVLDGRNAAAVFNAAAMAAGGGRGTGSAGIGGTLEALSTIASSRSYSRNTSTHSHSHLTSDSSDTEHGLHSGPSTRPGTRTSNRSRSNSRGVPLRITTSFSNHDSRNGSRSRTRNDSISSAASASASASTSASTSRSASTVDFSDSEGGTRPPRQGRQRRLTHTREIWTGDLSCVIGLQKRGLRGLMEGRRLRERSSKGSGSGSGPSLGLFDSSATGIAGAGAGAGIGQGLAQAQAQTQSLGPGQGPMASHGIQGLQGFQGLQLN